jgi:hypothetical protein
MEKAVERSCSFPKNRLYNWSPHLNETSRFCSNDILMKWTCSLGNHNMTKSSVPKR